MVRSAMARYELTQKSGIWCTVPPIGRVFIHLDDIIDVKVNDAGRRSTLEMNILVCEGDEQNIEPICLIGSGEGATREQLEEIAAMIHERITTYWEAIHPMHLTDTLDMTAEELERMQGITTDIEKLKEAVLK